MIKEIKKVDDDVNDDNDSDIFFSPKVFEVTTTRGRFFTPNRMVSKSEYNSKSRNYITLPMYNDLAIDFRIFDQPNFYDFITDNEKIKKISNKNNLFNIQTLRTKLKCSFYQPTQTCFENNSEKEIKKFFRLQTMLQVDSNNGIITVPFLNFSKTKYKQIIRKILKDFDSLQFIFTLDMAMPDFEEVLRFLISYKQPMIIAFIYRPFSNYALQHDVINSLSQSENVMFLACQVERDLGDSSNIHPLQFSSFDLIALRQSQNRPSEKIDPNRVKLFRPSNLKLENPSNIDKNNLNNIVDEFKTEGYVENDIKFIQEAFKNIDKIGTEMWYSNIYDLTVLHESIVSPQEFEVSRKFIANHETSDYIRTKSGLMTHPLINRKH